jgi:Ku protein
MARRSDSSTKESQQHTEARSFWSGTISFGLVTVPVNLYPAARRNRVALRMLSPDGNPLARRYFCPADEQEVDRDHLVRGYEISEDRYVLVDDETLAALSPRKSREIDLMSFVPLDQVPPKYYERSYYLTPSGDTNKGYRLLAEVMEASGRAGIATFVMRGKEYLVAIHSENGILRAETLRFQEELREPDPEDLPASSLASEQEVEALKELVQRHTRRNCRSMHSRTGRPTGCASLSRPSCGQARTWSRRPRTPRISGISGTPKRKTTRAASTCSKRSGAVFVAATASISNATTSGTRRATNWPN